MKAVKQEHISGCAVACVAATLGVSYKTAIRSFEKSEERAKDRGFYCKEIVQVLRDSGLEYSFQYVKSDKKYDYPVGTIVFLKKSLKYPGGHYIYKTEEGWMDPWINFPRLNARAGFRKRLPGKPTYAIIPEKNRR